MAVWLSLSLSQGSPNKTARTTTVSATLTIHYSGGSYDGTQPSGEITIDGQSFPFVKNFNYAGVGQGAASQGTGSTSITVTATVEYGSNSSRTVYASASFSRASGGASGSISLTPIGTSSGGSGGGSDDGDNGEEWEEGGSGGTTRKGNVSIIGQKSSTGTTSYKMDTINGIGLFLGNYVNTIIKFETPYIGGPSTYLNIDIGLSGNISLLPEICYAICVEDYNLGMYENASYEVNDPYQLQSGVLDYDGLDTGRIQASIRTGALRTEKIYYLVLWIPADSDFERYVQISYASGHVMSVDYINDGTGDPPDGRLPGNASPIGQAILQEASDSIAYYTNEGYEVTYFNGSISYSYIVIVKFVTPNFMGVSESIDVNLYGIKSTYNGDFTVQCALCTSDSNNGLYIHTTSVINDANQIASVALKKNEFLSMPVSIRTDKLDPQKDYYLIFWIPTDVSSGGSVKIGPAMYHGININYIESEQVVHIDNASKLDKYLCYIDSGTSFNIYECYVYNGSSWDLIES